MEISQFKKTISKFATGVTVITGCHEGKPFGVTVSSFASVSLDPLLISFNLDKSLSSLEAFKKSEFFNVHILSDKQVDIATIFATKNIDRFSKIKYENSSNTVPVINNSHAFLECQKFKTFDAGDHVIFLSKVISSNFDEDQSPMIYYNSKFHKLT